MLFFEWKVPSSGGIYEPSGSSPAVAPSTAVQLLAVTTPLLRAVVGSFFQTSSFGQGEARVPPPKARSS